MSDRLVILSLRNIGLMDNAVSLWPSDLEMHVAYLSVTFNQLTNIGLKELLRQETGMETLDLEDNGMELNPVSEGLTA